jgi:LmbE family N-acetylglucosaminyl deacetylase
LQHKRILVFAPHPDDETFGPGGTIAKKISEGYEVLIVIMTDGRYAFLKVLNIEVGPTPEELKQIRKEEVKKATSLLGVQESNIIFLDFEDGTLKNNEKKAEEEVTEILNQNHPCEVYVTYKNDFHSDHQAAYRIIKNSIRKLGISPLIYQYSIWRKYGRIAPIIDALLNLINQRMLRVDISEFLSIKKEALNEFKSELTIMSSKQRKPIMDHANRFLGSRETFYVDK